MPVKKISLNKVEINSIKELSNLDDVEKALGITPDSSILSDPEQSSDSKTEARDSLAPDDAYLVRDVLKRDLENILCEFEQLLRSRKAGKEYLPLIDRINNLATSMLWDARELCEGCPPRRDGNFERKELSVDEFIKVFPLYMKEALNAFDMDDLTLYTRLDGLVLLCDRGRDAAYKKRMENI